MFKETQWYIGGNTEHLGKPKRYLTNTRELLRLLHDHKIHVFSIDGRAEWLTEHTAAGEGRIKVQCDAKRVYASNEGLYTLA